MLIALGLIIVVSGGSGRSTAVHRHAIPAPGFFARVGVLSGTGAGSFTQAETSAENAAVDRTLAITPYVRFAGTQHRELALTFDDGPGPYTPQVLSVLEHLHVPATFFEVGNQEVYFHASTTRIVADGDPIGDHTETHAPMSELGPGNQQAQLTEEASSIGSYGAPFPRLFRPPYGLWDSETLALLRSYRMLMVLWTIDTNDYLQPGVSKIVNSVLSGARPGAIVLMHDAGGPRAQTIAAIPLIVDRLRSRGYKLVTVPRLLLDNPAPANQGYAVPGGGG